MASRQLATQRQAVLLAVPSVQILSSSDVIGSQVRAHRKKQGLRIDDAAALNGVSVDLMSRLENGSGSIRLDKLMRVLDGLGLTLLVAPKGHAYLQQLPTDRVLQPEGTPDPITNSAAKAMGGVR
jgi:transcriptional regulator with XRE-family HTH domain